MLAATLGLMAGPVWAGMGVPLPTPLTKDQLPHSETIKGLHPWLDERLQALSFFVAAVLVSAWVARGLWNLCRRDWPSLRRMSYRGALLATILWGLMSVVVLTMISGARELMTPGAWQKSGWTYRLAQTSPPAAEPRFRNLRRAKLEELRLELLKIAAMNEGRFPDDESKIGASLEIPANPGFQFLYRPGQQASAASASILVFEPELGDEERFVLLASGMIGSMRTSELEAALAPSSSVSNRAAP
jgi:hypothetical protein